MKIAIVTIAVCIAGALAWIALQERGARRDEQPQRVESAQSEVPALIAPSEQEAVGSELPRPVRTDDPVRAQEERLAFHARVRSFFAQAPAMDAADRQQAAVSLDAQIVEYERRGELSAGEALLLRSALVRESVDDARARAEQVAALDRQYRAESDRRRGEWAAQRDPMFELYKLREAAIVENVMAMAEIPDGLSRNEYLRRKLQEERELLFDGG